MSLMSVFDKLKQILNIENCSFTLVNIQYNSNNSNNTSDSNNQIDDQTLNIRWDLLTPQQREEVLSLLPEAVDSDIPLIEAKTKDQAEEIISKENSATEKPILKFFKDKIPPEDYTALRASLFLRSRFLERANKKEIDKLKSDIFKRYGKRGRNISDLCSAGYFEAFMEILAKMPEKDFSDVYESIIGKGQLAIFVPEGMSPIQVKTDVEKRIKKIRKYGGHGIIIVHGIGRKNIETIRIAIDDIKISFPGVVEIQILEKNNVINASFKF